MRFFRHIRLVFLLLTALSLVSCGPTRRGDERRGGTNNGGGSLSTQEEDEHNDGHGHDLDKGIQITTLALHFTNSSDGSTQTFVWADPENDGDPFVDAIFTSSGSSYLVEVEVWNELEDPTEDVTPEIADESDEFQFFFTGFGVQSPATGENPGAIIQHSYQDSDENGLPVGLANTMETLSPGSGELRVTLRHLPFVEGDATKVEGLSDWVASEGFSSIPGSNEIDVTFPLLID